AVASDYNAQHLTLNTPIEALHHAIGFRRVGPRRAMLHAQALARPLEAVSREAGAPIGQHVRDLEGKGLDGLLQEGHGAALSLVVLDREVHEAGGTIDGDIEVPLAALTVSRAQLGQVLHVHVHETKIVRLEAAMRSAGAISRWQAAQALSFQDAVDRVAIEMRQEVADHKGEVIQGKAGGTPQGADNGALFIRGFPRELVRAAGVVLAVGRPALTPLADGLSRDAIALSQDSGWLLGSSDLGADGRGGAGLRVDRWHQDLLARGGWQSRSKRQA